MPPGGHIIFYFKRQITLPTEDAMVSYLVNAGADKTVKNKSGNTPYDIAVDVKRHSQIVDLLK